MVGFGVDFVDKNVRTKYDLVKKVGRGLMGIVWRAKRRKNPSARPIAIKRIFNAFSNKVDAKRTYRELSYLLQFCHHPNIVTLEEVVASEDDIDIYLVMEYMDVDLATIIQSNLQQIHIEFLTWQLLTALKYIHSASVVHRDLKPSNILVNAKCGLRLCDFGNARSVVAHDPDRRSPIPKEYDSLSSTSVLRMTNYCSSRWYRSPEQLVNCRNYGTGIDMWSLGCVIGEMIQRRPIFPGTCTLLQLSLIVHLTGRPPDVDLLGINSKYVVQILEGLGNSKQGKISDVVPGGSRDAQDLIHLCLQFNPDKRITAIEALEHPFVGHFHNPDAEPLHSSASTGGVKLDLCDDVQYPVSAYRDHVYAHVLGNKRLKDQISRDRLIRENLLKGSVPTN